MNPILRWYGSKTKISEWIIRKFPRHNTYLEAFGGGGAVLLNKKPSQIEVFNDLEPKVVNFFKVLQSKPKELELTLFATPYAAPHFGNSPVEEAAAFCVQQVTGFSGFNARKKQVVLLDTSNLACSKAEVWSKWYLRVPTAHERFKSVNITNTDALKAIAEHEDPNTLIYCDPPYVLHEQDYSKTVDLKELIRLLKKSKSKIVLSGNEHFSRDLSGWWRDEREVVTASSSKKKKSCEYIYTNFLSSGIKL
jgi:DNA adenine methylase